MKKYLLFIFLITFCFSCNQRKNENVYTFEEFKIEFQEYFNISNVPIGTYFWDEFKGFEHQFHLTENETKLLGKWMNPTFLLNSSNHNYIFFPNKLFVLDFIFKTIQLTHSKNKYLDKAFGTWEIVDGIVRITFYAMMTEDDEKDHPHNKDLFFVERPYTVDFIHIDNIGDEGFTKRPINDTVFSEELKKMVTEIEPNKSNNLYVRNVYTLGDLNPGKHYSYFTNFPDMARNNHSGFEIATSEELIRRYFPDWMH